MCACLSKASIIIIIISPLCRPLLGLAGVFVVVVVVVVSGGGQLWKRDQKERMEQQMNVVVVVVSLLWPSIEWGIIWLLFELLLLANN